MHRSGGKIDLLYVCAVEAGETAAQYNAQVIENVVSRDASCCNLMKERGKEEIVFAADHFNGNLFAFVVRRMQFEECIYPREPSSGDENGFFLCSEHFRLLCQYTPLDKSLTIDLTLWCISTTPMKIPETTYRI